MPDTDLTRPAFTVKEMLLRLEQSQERLEKRLDDWMDGHDRVHRDLEVEALAEQKARTKLQTIQDRRERRIKTVLVAVSTVLGSVGGLVLSLLAHWHLF